MTARSYLSPEVKKEKTKDTLPSSSALDFSIYCLRTDIWQLWHPILATSTKGNLWEWQLGHISVLRSKSKNSKGTLLSSILKVEESKVPSVLWFLASGMRYCHFVILEEPSFNLIFNVYFVLWNIFCDLLKHT